MSEDHKHKCGDCGKMASVVVPVITDEWTGTHVMAGHKNICLECLQERIDDATRPINHSGRGKTVQGLGGCLC